ncbi:flagellar hook-length control protein FliK [Psychrobium sp. 1_MG-2023]|uniref:flagellar hook-length control protein FliK n=1 Tax=Psychrobium sp. 1_MG-2023 TaxID=3062624 RepID=UPI000C32917E|nr:flagellar hook-length control protein FliK [Psychrobium sp. 1_MG-2023]MDP2559833.1 flagellar hook-length control protein FliK [Psychrobium sp. 1_MG-2023]PKF59063.1 hypothetical protein CW748_02420 [Alteromonadales bacterium alter-6D02]
MLESLSSGLLGVSRDNSASFAAMATNNNAKSDSSSSVTEYAGAGKAVSNEHDDVSFSDILNQEIESGSGRTKSTSQTENTNAEQTQPPADKENKEQRLSSEQSEKVAEEIIDKYLADVDLNKEFDEESARNQTAPAVTAPTSSMDDAPARQGMTPSTEQKNTEAQIIEESAEPSLEQPSMTRVSQDKGIEPQTQGIIATNKAIVESEAVTSHESKMDKASDEYEHVGKSDTESQAVTQNSIDIRDNAQGLVTDKEKVSSEFSKSQPLVENESVTERSAVGASPSLVSEQQAVDRQEPTKQTQAAHDINRTNEQERSKEISQEGETGSVQTQQKQTTQVQGDTQFQRDIASQVDTKERVAEHSAATLSSKEASNDSSVKASGEVINSPMLGKQESKSSEPGLVESDDSRESGQPLSVAKSAHGHDSVGADTTPIKQLVNTLEAMSGQLADKPELKKALEQVIAKLEALEPVRNGQIVSSEKGLPFEISALEKAMNQALKQPQSDTNITDVKQQLTNVIMQLPPKQQSQLVAFTTEVVMDSQESSIDENDINLVNNGLRVADVANASTTPAEKGTQAAQQLLNQINQSKLSTLTGGETVVETANQAANTTAQDGTSKIAAHAVASPILGEQVIKAKGSAVDNELKLASEEQSLTDEVKVAEAATTPATKQSLFESLLKQVDAQGRQAQIAATNTEQPNSAVNARLDQQELSTQSTPSQPLTPKQLSEQLQQKLPLHEQFAATQLKERITMMANGGVSNAVIHLDPEELGAMSVRIQMQQDQLNVQFQVQNPTAKDMLEQAMVKLRDMLQEQGIALNQSDVQQQQQGDSNEHDAWQGGESDDDFESDQSAVTLTLHKQSANGIDYYA